MKGRVTERDGKAVLISVDRPDFCSGCKHRGSCAVGGGDPHVLRVPARPELTPGTEVDVELPPSCGLHLAAWAYGMPLALFLAGIGAGYALGDRVGMDREILALALGGFSLVIAVLFLHIRDRRIRQTLDRSITVVRAAEGSRHLEPRKYS